MSGMFGGCTRLAKLVLGANTSLSGMSGSSEITSCKWIKGAEADQNVVEGSYLLTANRDIEAGATEAFQKAVFFDANDGTGAAPTARSLYDLGWTYSAASVPDAVRGGYDFCGWYTAGSGGTKLTDGDALTPTTYYAQWTRTLHSLTVTNEVTGARIDKDKEFSITVSLEGDGVPTEVLYEKTGGGASTSGSIEAVDGKVSFALKADERIVLKDLPDGTAYAVSQAAEEDYETTVAGGAGTLTADATAALTNRYLVSASLPQTGSAGLALLFGLACVAGLAGLYRRHRMMG